MILDAEKIALAMELRECGFRWSDVAKMTGVRWIDQWVRQAMRYGLACCRPPVRWYPQETIDRAAQLRKSGMSWKRIAREVVARDHWLLYKAVARRKG
ncbi:hypothetical protein M1D96_06295 [Pseudomonas sp. D1-3]